MKKIILTSIIILLLLCSCSYGMKEWQRQVSYSDPQTIGGLWDITTSNGSVYEDCRCIYWGMDDDTAMFKLSDGRILALSGSYSLVQSD